MKCKNYPSKTQNVRTNNYIILKMVNVNDIFQTAVKVIYSCHSLFPTHTPNSPVSTDSDTRPLKQPNLFFWQTSFTTRYVPPSSLHFHFLYFSLFFSSVIMQQQYLTSLFDILSLVLHPAKSNIHIFCNFSFIYLLLLFINVLELKLL